MDSPTAEFYDTLQNIYHKFNEVFFKGALPNCLITVQRKKRVMGYLSSNRWGNKEGNVLHELALNPSYFATYNFIEVFQTMLHEMCHLWQIEYGKPSREGYHNKEWADKMESFGLIPSDTGKVGGKKTGQKMGDYPLKGGWFEKVCIQIYKEGLFLKWFDRFPEDIEHLLVNDSNNEEIVLGDESVKNLSDDEILETLHTVVAEVIQNIVPIEEVKTVKETAKAKQKVKYMCPSCSVAVWGKANLNLSCNDCNVDFYVV
jgi:predicted SprT family Zn-dependent metalloprotease